MSIFWPSTIQQLVRFSLLAILAIISFFAYIQYYQAEQPSILSSSQKGADGIMKAITVDEFDQSGNLLSQLKAEKAFQLHNEGQLHHPSTLFLHYPYLDVYTKDQQQWMVKAKLGTITKKASESYQKINLQGNVQLMQLDKNFLPKKDIKQKIITAIYTSRLNIDPKHKQATTDADVTIQQSPQKISGRGLFADLNSGKIRLYSNVHGHFEKIESNEST